MCAITNYNQIKERNKTYEKNFSCKFKLTSPKRTFLLTKQVSISSKYFILHIIIVNFVELGCKYFSIINEKVTIVSVIICRGKTFLG